jgi:rubredoxin
MKRLCPDCKVDGYRVLLRCLAGPWLTSWYGTLRYWRCRMCRSEYITQGNGAPEAAAL